MTTLIPFKPLIHIYNDQDQEAYVQERIADALAAPAAAEQAPQPLTDEQIDAISIACHGPHFGDIDRQGDRKFARALLAAAAQPPSPVTDEQIKAVIREFGGTAASTFPFLKFGRACAALSTATPPQPQPPLGHESGALRTRAVAAASELPQSDAESGTRGTAGWISIDERRPRDGQRIVGVSAQRDEHLIYECSWTETWDSNEPTGHMTHWMPMPLPAAPKETP